MNAVCELNEEHQAALAIALLRRAKDAIAKIADLIENTSARPIDGTKAQGQLARAMQILEWVADLDEHGPDTQWWRDYLLLTGEHHVRTEEGWMSLEMAGDMEVYDAVNAPKEPPHA